MRYMCVKLQRAQQRAWVPVLVVRPFPSFCLQGAGALPSAQALTPAIGRARPRSARACPCPSPERQCHCKAAGQQQPWPTCSQKTGIPAPGGCVRRTGGEQKSSGNEEALINGSSHSQNNPSSLILSKRPKSVQYLLLISFIWYQNFESFKWCFPPLYESLKGSYY